MLTNRIRLCYICDSPSCRKNVNPWLNLTCDQFCEVCFSETCDKINDATLDCSKDETENRCNTCLSHDCVKVDNPDTKCELISCFDTCDICLSPTCVRIDYPEAECSMFDNCSQLDDDDAEADLQYRQQLQQQTQQNQQQSGFDERLEHYNNVWRGVKKRARSEETFRKQFQ